MTFDDRISKILQSCLRLAAGPLGWQQEPQVDFQGSAGLFLAGFGDAGLALLGDATV